MEKAWALKSDRGYSSTNATYWLIHGRLFKLFQSPFPYLQNLDNNLLGKDAENNSLL